MDEKKPTSYSSNSSLSTEKKPNKNIKKVVNGRLRKKGPIESFVSAFIFEDLVKVKDHVIYEIVIPELKNIALDTFTSMLYGPGAKKNANRSTASTVSYRDYSSISKRDTSRFASTPSYRRRLNYCDVEFGSRANALAVLERMIEIIDVYDCVTVREFFDLAGITTDTQYTDANYGWTNLASAEPYRTADGWFLDLPKAVDLKR